MRRRRRREPRWALRPRRFGARRRGRRCSTSSSSRRTRKRNARWRGRRVSVPALVIVLPLERTTGARTTPSACTTTTRLLVTRCVRPRSWGSGGFETEVTDTKRRSKPGVASMKPGYTRKSERARRRFRAPRRADRTSRHPRFRHPRCRGLALGPSRRPQRRRRRAGRRHQQARRCHQQARRCHQQA